MSATVTIIGNLTADPELRSTNSGKDVVNFSVAYSPTRPDGSKGEVSFYNCTAWEYLAVNLAASLRKGDRVVVIGRLRQDRWEQDGEKRQKMTITVDEIAPSLRFATAEVTRVAKSDSNGSAAVSEDTPAEDDLFVS